MKNNPEDPRPLLGADADGDDQPNPNASIPQNKKPKPCSDESEVVGPTITVVGLPITGRAQWTTSIWSCLGRDDEFWSSDLEVCILGTVAPCVLYGSNMERIRSEDPGAFTSGCVTYAAFCVLGYSLFGANNLVPPILYPSRTGVRRRLNLEGNLEGLRRQYGCCGNCEEDGTQSEECETFCDGMVHATCHPFALCQEGREIRRRLPNPHPTFFLVPPGPQTIARH